MTSVWKISCCFLNDVESIHRVGVSVTTVTAINRAYRSTDRVSFVMVTADAFTRFMTLSSGLSLREQLIH